MAENRSGNVSWLVALIVIFLVFYVIRGLCPCAFARAREQARRARCMSNLKQFGLALNMYAQDHDEDFPPNLVTLWREGHVTDPSLFFCPTPSHHPQDLADVTDTDAAGKLISEHMHYCYVAGLKTTDPADCILAFDEGWNHGGDGANWLFIDGHVTWYAPGTMEKRLEKQLAELADRGREATAIRPPWSRWPEKPDGYGVRPDSKLTDNVAYVAVPVTVLAVGIGLILLVRRGRRRQAAAEPPE